MNKILNAFNDVADSYITDAFEYKKAKVSVVNWKWIAAVVCTFVFIISGVSIVQRMWDSGSPQTPQYIYQVGERITLDYGTCEYVEATDSFLLLRIQSNKEIEYFINIVAYKNANETERITYIATTHHYGSSGTDNVLTDVLTIYVDGVETSTIIIPDDGKEHEVVIDFSYLKENNYDIENSWELIGIGRFAMDRSLWDTETNKE